jgi:hypothetical protein
MLRFQMVSGGIVLIDPTMVAAVVEGEITIQVKDKSLLSGNNQDRKILTASMVVNGIEYCVEDPNRTVAKRIQEWKSNG